MEESIGRQAGEGMKAILLILALSVTVNAQTVAITVGPGNVVLMEREQAFKLYLELRDSGKDPNMLGALLAAGIAQPDYRWQECDWVRQGGQEKTKINCELFP